jgi:spermidine synthase
VKKQAATGIPPIISPAQRRYLFFTAAVTGAAIMIVEILGAKMLAPYVGTSHFVWTAQIAVTLVALAGGYYLGGRWADRSPKIHLLFFAIFAAALYLIGAAMTVERVALACLRFSLPVGSLLASSLLFFVPLALLAMTGPFLVKVLTSALQSVGGSMGRLTAVSTLGSFAGTILIGYVLIPLLPNSLTMIFTAGVLILTAAGYLVIWGTGRASKVAALLALMLGSAGGWGMSSPDLLDTSGHREICRVNSNFGQLQIFESKTEPYRYFLNDYLTQGSCDTDRRQSIGSWSYLLHELARAYTPALHDALVIGLGAGLVPMQFADEGTRVDVVEINPAVAPLAEKYFFFQPQRVNLTLGDGRQFLNACQKKYDAVILDTFLGDSGPTHLMTQETFAIIRERLRPEGVLVINCWGDFDPGKDFLVASVYKTLSTVFAEVQIHSRTNTGNVFIMASPAPLVLHRPPTFDGIHPESRANTEQTFSRVVQVDPAHGIVLTDDYNPLEYRDAANREEQRRAMVLSMQAVANEGR